MLEKILDVVNKIKEEDIIITVHFENRFSQRGFSSNPKQIFNNILLGIYNQNHDKYKLIFKYTEDLDLILICNININTKQIILITIFLESSKKRLREDGI